MFRIYDRFDIECFHWPSSGEQTTTATTAQLKTNKNDQACKQKACQVWAQSGVFEGTWSSVQHVYIFDCFIVKCFHWPSSDEQTTTATTAQLKTNKNDQPRKQKACQGWAQSGVFEGTWSSVQHVYIFDCFIVKCFHWPSSDEQTTTATTAQLKQTKFTNHASRRHAKVELNLGFLRASEAQCNMFIFMTVLMLSASTDQVLMSRPQQPQLPSYKPTKLTNHAGRRHAKVEHNLGNLRAHEAQCNMFRFLTVWVLSASTDQVLVSRPQQPQLPS